MNIIWTILVGFLVGLIARFLRPGPDPAGFVVTVLIGIAGSLVATYGGQALRIYQAGQPAGFIGAVIGALVVLWLYHRLTRGRSAT
jgi:uncharacterized membrane protein YeaQ/YmgE (transglycosylase-associated protein family)